MMRPAEVIEMRERLWGEVEDNFHFDSAITERLVDWLIRSGWVESPPNYEQAGRTCRVLREEGEV